MSWVEVKAKQAENIAKLYENDPDGQDRLGVPIHNCYDMEVIGNVHENTELLEENNGKKD